MLQTVVSIRAFTTIKNKAMPLPTLNVTITSLAPPVNGRRATATFAQGTGFPAWAQLNEFGDIDVTGAPNQPGASGTAVAIAFTLALNPPPTPALTFVDGNNAFVPPQGNTDFGVPVLSNNNSTVTVTDANNEARFTELEYNLTFSDGTVLDPRMINR